MDTKLFDGLSVFLAVAEHRSFSKAARALDISTAAVSQKIRKLEQRLGLPLFQRTSRQVGFTEAGKAFHCGLGPAASQIADAIEGLNTFRQMPVGHLRLTAPRIAMPLVVEPILAQFRHSYPDISVEVKVEDAAVALESHGLDAGIRFGGSVEVDMVAIRLTRDVMWRVYGAPTYLDSRGRPSKPQDLAGHECIQYRFPTSGALQSWEFDHGKRVIRADVLGRIITSDSLSLLSLAQRGLGLIYSADLVAAEEVAMGRLAVVLSRYARRTPGLFLYFPKRMQSQTKLRAFIDTAIQFR